VDEKRKQKNKEKTNHPKKKTPIIPSTKFPSI